MMQEQVEKVLAGLRPALQADGGNIELIEVSGNVVKVRLQGACGTCPMATATLKQFVEVRLKEQIPEIDRVEAV